MSDPRMHHEPGGPELGRPTEDRIRATLRAEHGALTHRAAAAAPTRRRSRLLRGLVPVVAAVALIGGGAAGWAALSGDDGQEVVIDAPEPTPAPIPTATTGPAPTATAPGEPTPEPTDGPQPTPPPTPLPATPAPPTTAPSAEPGAAEPTLPVPTPTPVPAPVDPGECSATQTADGWRFDIVDVAPDDADGGLVVHTEPGASTPVVGVLPWNAMQVQPTAGCRVVDDGGVWWDVVSGDLRGWVNSRYLGDRLPAEVDLGTTPCGTVAEDADVGAVVPEPVGLMVVSDLHVSSGPECDRVIIEFGQNWDFGSTTLALDHLPADAIEDIMYSPSGALSQWVEFNFTTDLASAFDSIGPVKTWRDEATGESNAVVTFDGDDDRSPSVHVGFGSGRADVRILQNPARIVVDITQTPSPEGFVTGPITGAAILFEPIQPDLTGAGVELPIRVRGYSRGFEGFSLVQIARWDEEEWSDPDNWGGELWGRPDAEALGAADATLSVNMSSFDLPGWGVTTGGLLDFTIDDLAPGAYQLGISPGRGTDGAATTGQQFRVAGPDDDSSAVRRAAEPFDFYFLGREMIESGLYNDGVLVEDNEDLAERVRLLTLRAADAEINLRVVILEHPNPNNANAALPWDGTATAIMISPGSVSTDTTEVCTERVANAIIPVEINDTTSPDGQYRIVEEFVQNLISLPDPCG